MPPEEIGVKSIWETREFQAGLQTYLRGLAQATLATQRASSILNSAFSGVGGQINSGVAAQIQQITRAAAQGAREQANQTVQQERATQALLRTEQQRAVLQARQAQAARSLIAIQTAQNQQATQSVQAALRAQQQQQQAAAQSAQAALRIQQQQANVQGAQARAARSLIAVQSAQNQQSAQAAQAALRSQQQQVNLQGAQARATRSLIGVQTAQNQQQAAASRAQTAAINTQIAAQNRLVRQATGNLRVQAQTASAQAAQQRAAAAATRAQITAQQQLVQQATGNLRVQQQTTILQGQQARNAQQAAKAQTQATQTAAQGANRLLIQQQQLAAATARTSTAQATLNKALSQTNAAASSANRGVRGLTVGTIALGTALGVTAVNALRQFLTGLRSFVQTGLEAVTFFERFRLSVNFFEARSLSAKDTTLELADALEQTQNAGEGTLLFLQQLAILSPFTTQDVAQTFRVAQSYGLLADQAKTLIPLLLDLGAATGLDIKALENAARALGQVQSIGRLTGEEIRQLGNAGIPIRDLLNKTLGTTNEEFNKLLESGSLTADIVLPAITKELEQFAGAGEKVATETIGGLLSVLQEVKQLGTAKLFEGVFEPLRVEFQKLAETLNDNQTFAVFRVIGENIGQFIGNSIAFARTAIKDLIQAWQDLEPQMRQAIVNFGIAFVAITALVGAFGLLTLALNVLLNPFVLLTTLLAAFVADYTTGFGFIKRITDTAAKFLGKQLAGIADAFGLIPDAIEETADGSMSLLDTFAKQIAKWIAGVANIVASGLTGILGFINQFLGAFADTAATLSAPSNAIEVSPRIDITPQAATKSLNDQLIEQAKEAARSQTVDEELEGMGLRAGQKFNGGFEQALMTQDFFAPDVKNKLEAESETKIEPAAGGAGLAAGKSYVDGFLDQLPRLNDVVSEEVQKVLDKIGGDFPRLSVAGASAIGSFIDGFKDADFGVLDTILGDITSAIQTAGQLEGASDQSIIRRIFGAREDVAQALAELKQFGRISEQTLRGIGQDGTFAGLAMEDLLRAFGNLAPLTAQVEISQKKLNDITERYKRLLEPVRKELEAIQAIRRGLSEDREIRNLQRVVNNLTFSDARRKEAQANIDEILAQRRLSALEKESTTATEAAQKQLDADEKRRTEAEKEFELVRARLAAQREQLDLVAQEAELFKKLNEELEKAREKELSIVERQQKIAGLRNQEIADRIKEAKAAFTLDDAAASLLDKERARQDLIEIGLDRQARLEEAAKLGLADPTVLTSLRDLEVTLDDIGVKQKEILDPKIDALTGALPNTVELTARWNETLTEVRTRFDEIKGSILETFTELNENVPDFLKFLPEEEGGEAPIVKTLGGIALGIGAIAAASTAASFVTLLGGIASGFTGIATALGISAGGAAAVSGLPIILALGTFAGLVLLATQGLPSFVNDLDRFGKVLDKISKIKTPAWFTNFINFITTPPPEAGAGGKFDLVTHLPIQTEPSTEQKNQVRDAAGNLANVFIEEANNQIGTVALGSIFNPVLGSLALLPGLVADTADVGEFIGTTWNEGIQAGVDKSENKVLDAIGGLILAILNRGKEEGEIDSPSELTKREIGIPLAEGIAAGFEDSLVLVTDAIGVYTQSFVTFFADTVTSWRTFRADLLLEAGLVVDAISLQFDNLALVVLPKVLDFHQGVTDEFAAMNNDIAVITLSIIGNVQTMATSLGGSLAQIGEQASSFVSPNQSNGVPSVVNNVSRNNTFQLNVTSSVPSQGLIGDFTILQVMASTN